MPPLTRLLDAECLAPAAVAEGIALGTRVMLPPLMPTDLRYFSMKFLFFSRFVSSFATFAIAGLG